MKRAKAGPTLRYIAGKQGAYQVAGNMGGITPNQLTQEFRLSHNLKPEIKNPYYHISLSLRNSKPEDFRWREVVDKYVERMGLTNCQYVAYRHTDTIHDHVHLVACRIRGTDGYLVPEWRDRYKSMAVLRELEKEYPEFEQEPSSKRLVRGTEREDYRYFERTGRETGRMEIQRNIGEVAREVDSFADFREKLAERGITVGLKQTRTGKIQGISYATEIQDKGEWRKIAFTGGKLGKGYTWKGLHTEFGLSRSGIENREAVIQASEDYRAQHININSVQRVELTAERERRRELKLKYKEVKAFAKKEAVKYLGNQQWQEIRPENMDKLIARYGEVFNMRPNEINEMIERRELWDKYHLIEEATKAEITRGRLGNWESISPEKQQKAISIVAKDRFGMREDQIARLVEKPELRQQYERVKAAARNRVVELYGEKKWQSIEPKKIDRMVVSFANTDFNMPPEKIGEMIQHSSQYIRGLNGLPPEQRKKAIGELNSDYGKWVDWNKESEGQAEAAPEISRERQRESDLEL